jgi:hypothetical protein
VVYVTIIIIIFSWVVVEEVVMTNFATTSNTSSPLETALTEKLTFHLVVITAKLLYAAKV